MSTFVDLTLVLVVCPGLLAMWFDTRYPSLRPKELRRTALHLGATGLLAFILLKPALIGVAMLLEGVAARATSVTIACVVITYCMMVTLWVMRSAAELARTPR